MVSTVVPDGPHKVFCGGLPTYLSDDQVRERGREKLTEGVALAYCNFIVEGRARGSSEIPHGLGVRLEGTLVISCKLPHVCSGPFEIKGNFNTHGNSQRSLLSRGWFLIGDQSTIIGHSQLYY